MHYKNGREATNGDKVIVFPSYGAPYVGIMYDSVAGNDYCNGKVAVTSPSDPMINLQEAVHLDDLQGLIPTAQEYLGGPVTLNLQAVPDTSKNLDPVPQAGV